MKTYSPKPEHIQRHWYVVDASGQVLGRLASEVATLLRGKHKPMYAPHMDTGDHVIVINADKIELTGNKAEKKVAYRHSGYPGGITGIVYTQMLAERPIQTIEKAVRGMLPKNTIGRQMLKKLHVVPGPEHPHAAQKPVPLTLGERPAWDGLPAPKAAAGAPAIEKPAAEKPAAKPRAAKPKAEKPVAKPKPAAKPKAGATVKPAPKKSAAKKAPAKAEAEVAPAEETVETAAEAAETEE